MTELARVTIPEAACLAGIRQECLEEAVRSHKLQSVRLGRRRVVRTTPLWLAAWRGQPEASGGCR